MRPVRTEPGSRISPSVVSPSVGPGAGTDARLDEPWVGRHRTADRDDAAHVERASPNQMTDGCDVLRVDVQTVFVRLTASRAWMCVPTSPAGCFPENSATDTLLISPAGMLRRRPCRGEQGHP